MAALKKDEKTQIYEGILYKQGRVSKSWKERFFVLYSDRTLAYFKSEEAWEDGKDMISQIDLSAVRSIAPTKKKDVSKKAEAVEKQMKKTKSRRGSLSRKWSIDFGAIFGSKGGGGDDEDVESDNDQDGEIAFIEFALNQQFSFEIVQAKRTYNLCTDDPAKFNKWLSRLETTTFGKKVYKGWLLKQSERHKKWDKRWFIIYNTQEMRYFDDATRAMSRGMAVLTQLKKITQVDDEKAKKKYKQTSVLKLEFKQRTLLLSCAPSDDRRIWFEKICKLNPSTRHIDAIYDDYLYRYYENNEKWKKSWFLLDESALYQFSDMKQCDEYTKHGYFDDKEHDKMYNKYVTDRIQLAPFDPKKVQKIRPGSNLQTRLGKECIFIIHSKAVGKIFFATEQHNQLNRWFKKIRSLGRDEGRRSSKAGSSVMTESSLADMARADMNGRSSPLGNQLDPKQIRVSRSKGQNRILALLKALEDDFKVCRKDISFVKDCWDKNNEDEDEEEDDDDEKYDDEDD